MKNKGKKGITLIALIITIVVLLVLAIVTINIVIGKNGIIGKAFEAVNATNIEEAKAKLMSLLSEYKIVKVTEAKDLMEFLNEKASNGEIDYATDLENGTILIKAYGYKFIIDKDTIEIISAYKDENGNIEAITTMYQSDGNEIASETKYARIAITVKITNKRDFNTIDSIILKDSNNTEITKEENVIGDDSADVSFIVSKSETYLLEVTATKDGKQQVKTFQIIVTQAEVRARLNVGDYIEYEPDINTNNYSKLNVNNTNSYSNNDIKQETLNWQILKINEDGSMDIIGSPTTREIYFGKAVGYNNSVKFLNEICSTFYSKVDEGIVARSVRAEDLEYWLTDTGKNSRDNYALYGHTQTYIPPFTKYPELYANEKGSMIDSKKSGLVAGVDKESGNTSGLDISDSNIQETTYAYRTAQSTLTATSTFYYIGSIDETNYGEGAKVLYNSSDYWVASRYVWCYTDRAYFGIRYAGTKYYGAALHDSRAYDGSNYYGKYSVRPVVTLNSAVQIETSENATNVNTPHTITQY